MLLMAVADPEIKVWKECRHQRQVRAILIEYQNIQSVHEAFGKVFSPDEEKSLFKIVGDACCG